MYRYEKKYLLKNSNDFSAGYLNFYLKKKNIIKLHESNEINNIYYDTIDFKNYHFHIEGNLERYKVRIRWYKKNFFEKYNFFLEIKKRINKKNNKYKISLPIKSIKEIKKFDINPYLKKLNKKYNFEKKSFNFKPVLINKYRRSYYYYKEKNNRITVDTNLMFSKINDFKKNYFLHTNIKLIEHKYLTKINKSFFLDSNLKLLSGSFSKYLVGLEKLRLIQ